jgi:hypothetical protein
MRLSARRIRSINHAIARANGIICGALDRPVQRNPEPTVSGTPGLMAGVVKIVAVSRSTNA